MPPGGVGIDVIFLIRKNVSRLHIHAELNVKKALKK
jgi:hypothetical protein